MAKYNTSACVNQYKFLPNGCIRKWTIEELITRPVTKCKIYSIGLENIKGGTYNAVNMYKWSRRPNAQKTNLSFRWSIAKNGDKNSTVVNSVARYVQSVLFLCYLRFFLSEQNGRSLRRLIVTCAIVHRLSTLHAVVLTSKH